jgi:hypothetical protein
MDLSCRDSREVLILFNSDGLSTSRANSVLSEKYATRQNLKYSGTLTQSAGTLHTSTYSDRQFQVLSGGTFVHVTYSKLHLLPGSPSVFVCVCVRACLCACVFVCVRACRSSEIVVGSSHGIAQSESRGTRAPWLSAITGDVARGNWARYEAGTARLWRAVGGEKT